MEAPFLCYNSFMVKLCRSNCQEARQSKHTPQHPMPVALRVLLSVIFLAIVATIFTWFVLWRQNLCDTEVTWEFVHEKPQIFWYSTILMFLMMSVVVALLWRTFFGTGICFAILSVITYIHMQKFQFRSAPLLPEDFRLADQAGTIAQFVDPWSIVRLVGGVVLILLGSGLLEYYARKFIGRNKTGMKIWERWALLPRVSFALVALAALTMASSFLIHRNIKTDFVDEYLGLEFNDWDPAYVYAQDGFILGFIYNLGTPEVEEPKNYNSDTVAEVAKKYQKLKAADKDRKDLNEVVDNVIVILDESFYDFALLEKFYPHTGGDITPELHKIFQNYPSGYMFSTQYGGGTANVEFEVMTGLTIYWMNGTAYTDAVSRLDQLGSVANWAKASGFETTAIHGYRGTMYKRDVVYPVLGYNKFLDEAKMAHADHENGGMYISDQAMYQEILDVLQDGEAKHMVGAVTIQNHMSYDAAGYQELNFLLEQPIEEHYQMESYFETVHHADEYLGEFVRALDQLEERTVVLWFGDHAPALLNEVLRSADPTEQDLARLTPYFIYANFDLDEDRVTEIAETTATPMEIPDLEVQGVDLPIVTPNCLLNTMYNILGVEKPLLMYVVDDVCRETPILARVYSQSTKLPETKLLSNYELITYDLLYGKHYWPE